MVKSDTQRKESFEADSFEINVTKNQNFKPFLNVFKLEGKNVAQAEMGTVFGVIHIEDNSKNSEYIPNLLTQVIKKEFFRNTKRSADESFEHALHKANLALTDLAQHEVIEWMGGFNAVVGVLKENELHFVQVGKARAFLIRDKELTDITPNETQNSITHPVKTFSSVSSGKIDAGDKIILTLESALNFISQEEIERHSKTFSSDEFDNIFSSTLESDGDNTGALVINIKKKELKKAEDSEDDSLEEKIADKELNYFGQKTAGKEEAEEKKGKEEEESKPTGEEKAYKADEKKISPEENFEDSLVEAQEIDEIISESKQPKDSDKNKEPGENEPKEESAKASEEEREEKTEEFFHKSEIYLKEDDFPEEFEREMKEKEDKLKRNRWEELLNFLKLKINSLQERMAASWREKNFRQKIKSIQKKDFKSHLKKICSACIENLKRAWIFLSSKSKAFAFSLLEHLKKPRKPAGREEALEEEKGRTSPLENTTPSRDGENETNSRNKFGQPAKWAMNFAGSAWNKISNFFSGGFLQKKAGSFLRGTKAKIKALYYNKLSCPLFKMENCFPFTKNFSGKRKKVFFITVIMFFAGIIIFFIANLLQESNSPDAIAPDKDDSRKMLVKDEEGEKMENLKSINRFESRVIDSASINNNIFFLTEEKKMFQFKPKENSVKSISLPEELKEPKYLASMQSLQLIMIVSSDKIYSYSPVTENFFDNRINLPEDYQNKRGVGTYLTYIYLPSVNDNQIYRYPRARGGFGAYERWFDDQADMEKATDIDVSDSVFATFEDGTVAGYFQGKKQFQTSPVENFMPYKITTKVDAESFFVLDIKNGKVIKFDLNGNVQKEFVDSRFEEAQDFYTDFENQRVYVVDSGNSLLVFDY